MGYAVPIAVDTTGSAGSATGDTTSDIVDGILIHAFIAYHGSAPDTTDVTIKELLGGNEDTLVTVANNKTNKRTTPTTPQSDDDGVDFGTRVPNTLAGKVKVEVAGCDELTKAVTVYLVLA